WVHDVVWAPDTVTTGGLAARSVGRTAPPTLSVHAYSPPLTAMPYYDVTDRSTLRRKRTELTDKPEGD
ncbi:cysteine dioxygenase, partial [Mycobacterium sp. ITM-2017-0098]